MPDKFIKPGETVGLRLTAAERALLVEEIPVPNETIIKRIKEAPADRIKVPFTLDEVNVLKSHIASKDGHCNSRTRQKSVNAIKRKVEHLLKTYSDDEAEAWSHAKAMMANAGIDLGFLNPAKQLLVESGLTMDGAPKRPTRANTNAQQTKPPHSDPGGASD